MEAPEKDNSHPAATKLAGHFVRAAKFALFAFALGLIFNALGYVPEHLRLALIYLLLLQPILFGSTPRKLILLAVLAAAILANTIVAHNPMFRMGVLLLTHFCVWTTCDRGWRTFYPAVAFFALVHVFLFLSPQGYFPLDDMARTTSSLFSKLMHGPCNLGYTYLNIGSLLLFATLSVFMIRSPASLFRTACFLLVAVLLTAFIVTFVLFKADLNVELMLKFEFRTYFGLRQYAEFCSRLIILFFPAILFTAHLALFEVFHFPVAFKGRTGKDGGS